MAVAIGHPHPATLALLERELPKLGGEGFRLVDLGTYVLLAEQHARYGNPDDRTPIQTVHTTKNAWPGP